MVILKELVKVLEALAEATDLIRNESHHWLRGTIVFTQFVRNEKFNWVEVNFQYLFFMKDSEMTEGVIKEVEFVNLNKIMIRCYNLFD